MTTPGSGAIGVSTVNAEMGRGGPTGLAWLKDEIKPSLRTNPPRLSAFYGMSYFQNNAEGNCENGNCTANCNCGNIQCTNCLIAGYTNCLNCDDKAYLQPGSNCGPAGYNCVTSETSYNCNCACNCSKIICSKLHDKGLMPAKIFAADQAYGKWLYKNDKAVYRGYIRWARIVTAWMDGKGPAFMVWIKDDEKRNQLQREAITRMALRIGSPWSLHMAFLMGAVPNDNLRGRVLMTIGVPICRLLDKIPRVREKNKRHRLPVLYAMWAAFYLSHWTASAVVAIDNLLHGDKNAVHTSV
jgi:hypothetical protein